MPPVAPEVTGVSTGPGEIDDVVVYIHYRDSNQDGYGFEWQWEDGSGFERHLAGESWYGTFSNDLATQRHRACSGLTYRTQYRVFDRTALYSPWVTVAFQGRSVC